MPSLNPPASSLILQGLEEEYQLIDRGHHHDLIESLHSPQMLQAQHVQGGWTRKKKARGEGEPSRGANHGMPSSYRNEGALCGLMG